MGVGEGRLRRGEEGVIIQYMKKTGGEETFLTCYYNIILWREACPSYYLLTYLYIIYYIFFFFISLHIFYICIYNLIIFCYFCFLFYFCFLYLQGLVPEPSRQVEEKEEVSRGHQLRLRRGHGPLALAGLTAGRHAAASGLARLRLWELIARSCVGGRGGDGPGQRLPPLRRRRHHVPSSPVPAAAAAVLGRSTVQPTVPEARHPSTSSSPPPPATSPTSSAATTSGLSSSKPFLGTRKEMSWDQVEQIKILVTERRNKKKVVDCYFVSKIFRNISKKMPNTNL